VLAALPLKLMGLPDPPQTDDTSRGNSLLYHGDRYEKNLARARMGNLLLLIAAIVAVAALANRTFGREIAVIAVALFTNLPPVLAHAGLMTTDMAVTAALPLAILALDLFLEKPTWKRAATLGAAIGMGVLAKFSFLVFFPAAAIVLLLVRRSRTRLRPLALTFLIAFFVTWAGYRFDFRPISSVFKGASFFIQMAVPESMRQSVREFSDSVPIPAPALPVGIGVLKEHDKHGHQTFLLGQTGMKGWWYYFPVVFFFKTPIPFLILVAFGLSRRGIEHALIPLAILLVSMTGSINIGVRHVLPMYPFLSIVAAFGVVRLWRRTRGAFVTLAFAALMAWLVIGAAAAHPDYLGWYNEAAGRKPWRIAADSNLDWGQDVLRLERAARELKIEKVWIRYSASVDLTRHGIRSENLPDHPVAGWIVLGETPITFFPDRVAWLTERYEPVRRIGTSMRLYYVP
jgi:4-amino-4-deoxy-L-arabinose transferase-like glycosyltransferase